MRQKVYQRSSEAGGGKEMENYCSNGMMRKFWKQRLAMLTQHRNVTNTTELHDLKWRILCYVNFTTKRSCLRNKVEGDRTIRIISSFTAILSTHFLSYETLVIIPKRYGYIPLLLCQQNGQMVGFLSAFSKWTECLNQSLEE